MLLKGKVYRQKKPKTLIRIKGGRRWKRPGTRWNNCAEGCGEVFTAEPPKAVGPEKYDATAAAMIAQLRYGSGVPFQRLQRLQRLEGSLGIPLTAATNGKWSRKPHSGSGLHRKS